MVARIAEGDTTQWQVMDWVWEQGQYLTSTQQLVLAYLACHAFYRKDNPENGEVGQVMRQASYADSISQATSLNRYTIRKAMNALQMAGYIQRQVRNEPGTYGQQPHLIYVLWDCHVLHEGLRNGTMRLPAELMGVPTHLPGDPVRHVLAIVKDGNESAI